MHFPYVDLVRSEVNHSPKSDCGFLRRTVLRYNCSIHDGLVGAILLTLAGHCQVELQVCVKLRVMKRTAKRPKRPPYKVQVLDRAINIIEFIGQQSTGEAGLSELSLAMKLHKTTAHRIAHVLESRGLLRRGLDSNRYRLGLHLYDLGCQALDHVNIRDEARPFMTRIALEVGERCT
jgi:IclR helix-turn-helix domain